MSGGHLVCVYREGGSADLRISPAVGINVVKIGVPDVALLRDFQSQRRVHRYSGGRVSILERLGGIGGEPVLVERDLVERDLVEWGFVEWGLAARGVVGRGAGGLAGHGRQPEHQGSDSSKE